ncbi:hypothetical protein ACFLVO_04135 [Chloroflexota bacterium]
MPELKSLVIRWHYDVIAANDTHRVLDIRTVASGIACPLIRNSQSDIDGKSDGFGNLYRIYPKGMPVTLTAPKDYDKLTFSHWEVYPPGAVSLETSLEECELKLSVDYAIQVNCHYTRREDKERLPAYARSAVSLAISAGRPPHEVENIVQELLTGESEIQPGFSPNILTKPTLEEEVTIGYLPRFSSFTHLEGPLIREGREWLKIDYHGLVGWIYKETEKEEGSQKLVL